jgi:hypothetical protein
MMGISREIHMMGILHGKKQTMGISAPIRIYFLGYDGNTKNYCGCKKSCTTLDG